MDTQAVLSLVSRHLPQGVQCSAVRLRGHDRLCLVVINDKREFWSREDDMRRAKAITEDLRALGMELPRLQWIRQSRFLAESPYLEHSLCGQPAFWINCVCGVFAFFALSWWAMAVYAGLAFCTWLLSSWLISGGGWAKLQNLLPFLKRGTQW